MSYDPYALPEDVQKNIVKTARAIAVEFGHSDPDDLVQHCWEWIGSFPKQSAKWWYEATDNTIKFSWVQFKRDMARVCAEQARRDKRALNGLLAEDEYNYAKPIVEMYLPYVWHSEVLAALGAVDDGGPKAKVDKATTGDAMASALDVRMAYAAVIDAGSKWDQSLFLVYGLGYTQQEAADTLGVSQVMVFKRLEAAIEEIALHLNGTPGGAEYRTDGPGTRHVGSNAQAQSVQAMYTNGG
jgi:DNA-directed RNA polymerase specialized sigma24 family protein